MNLWEECQNQSAPESHFTKKFKELERPYLQVYEADVAEILRGWDLAEPGTRA